MVVDRIPSGTRDVLPDEMRELRAMTDRIRGVFEQAGYGEVYTPALEYERTFARGDIWMTNPAYRMFDEQGNVFVLRSDMTVPIARVAATRYAHADPPLRFCYQAHAYRGVRPQRGQSREFLQAGIELIGSPAPEGTVEVLSVLCAALDAAGLETYRVGLGDASLYPSLLESLDVAVDRPGADPGRARRRRLRGGGAGDPRARALRRERRAAPRRAANARRARGARRPHRRARGGRHRHARRSRPARPRGGRPHHLRLRARAQPGLLHGRRVPGLRPRARGPDRERRPLRRASRPVRAPAARGRLRAQRRARAHRSHR